MKNVNASTYAKICKIKKIFMILCNNRQLIIITKFLFQYVKALFKMSKQRTQKVSLSVKLSFRLLSNLIYKALTKVLVLLNILHYLYFNFIQLSDLLHSHRPNFITFPYLFSLSLKYTKFLFKKFLGNAN